MENFVFLIQVARISDWLSEQGGGYSKQYADGTVSVVLLSMIGKIFTKARDREANEINVLLIGL